MGLHANPHSTIGVTSFIVRRVITVEWDKPWHSLVIDGRSGGGRRGPKLTLNCY